MVPKVIKNGPNFDYHSQKAFFLTKRGFLNEFAPAAQAPESLF